MTPTRILGIYYTNNRVKKELLAASISSIFTAAAQAVNSEVHLALSSWEAVPHWEAAFREHSEPTVTQSQYLAHYRNNGHLNICLQILQVLYSEQRFFDLVCFLEHDVLYAHNYFDKVAYYATEVFPARIITNMNYIGMTEKGYVTQDKNQGALSQLSMPLPIAVAWFEQCVKICIKQGWCFLEPGYPDPPRYIIPAGIHGHPNVHVNMNHTTSNHHFTNHYETYSSLPFCEVHPLWGDFRNYQFFTI